MADSAFFSSPPLGVERPGEAGAAEAVLGIDLIFSVISERSPPLPTSPPQGGREEK
jgi:hypothetical protein